MKQSSDKKTNSDPAKKGKPKQPGGGYNINLGYILLFTTLLLFYIFSNPVAVTKEITWQEFENTMLSQNEVAKIVFIN